VQLRVPTERRCQDAIEEIRFYAIPGCDQGYGAARFDEFAEK
jgi:hypothetical protein